MKIKNFFKKIQQPSLTPAEEHYLAVLIEDNFVKTALWTLTNQGVVEVVRIGEKIFFETDEELVEAVDRSLSPHFADKEFRKVIFGVPSSWLLEGQLKEEKLEVLKKICREMELSAIGFVFNTEALLYYFKIKEGIPLTAILVSFGPKKLVFSLVKLGKIIKIEEIIRSGNLKEDLVEAFWRFKGEEVLPARIILYNQENLEEEVRQISEISWEEKEINFIHLPKVETLPSHFEILSLVLAGGKELGQAEKVILNQEAILKEELPGKEIKEEVKEIEKETPLKIEQEPVSEEEGVSFEETQPEESTSKPEIFPENFGFVKGEDILIKEGKKEEKPEEITPEIAFRKKSEELPSSQFERPKIRINLLESIKGVLKKSSGLILFFKKGLGVIKNLPLVKIKSKFVLILLIILGILGIILFSAWWFLPKAQITLWIKPQLLEKSFTLTLDSNISQPDEQNLILPAEKIKITLTKEGKKETTGTKIEGEPASGEVVIYNRTSNPKTFAKGTEIIGPDNLKFTLEEEVLVASESVGSDYVKIPGKAKVKVKAVAIGPEGNLASGTEFSVDNYSKSDFVAKNEEAFSGGTKREVQVVSRQDQEELEKNLLEELKKQSQEEIEEKTSSGQEIIPKSLSFEIRKKEFDKKVGDEGNEVNLKLEVEFSVLSFRNEDFNRLLEKEISSSIPEGFEYKPEEKESNFKLKELKGKDKAIFEANLKVFLFPKLDVEMIKNNLKGKSLIGGKNYLDSLEKIDSYQIKISPQFPKWLITFPRISKNITIEVKRK